MTPTPQENIREEMPSKKMRPTVGEEVVISGMSGIFPMSNSVEEFSKNLFNKVDMITTEDARWVFDHPEMPKHLGKVNNMGKFDAQFFRVHHKQAATMEPMSRKLLEHAYSAIYDSGVNPLQLRGKKVGVFIGSSFSESEKIVIYEHVQRNGFGITGCNKAMYANRISYWIDGKGPSYALDLACASSMACLEHAYRSISSGQCDAAIVGGCNLCMHPNVSLNFRRAGFLSLDGKTRCFDKNCEGYVRSDAISVLFLQKAKDAKRIYSEVYHAKCSYSPASEQLLPIRKPKELQEFFEAFYSEIDVSPADVEYVEANGAALKEADSNEMMAIGRVFGKNHPIQIGCVKSNMGSSEPASGVCALTKVCLAFHNGKIPGNLHFVEPLDIPEVKENKLQILTDTVNFKGKFAALNSFSYGGANVHVLLKGYYKEKDDTRYKSSIPYLVLVSGRQEDCMKSILDKLKMSPVDPEQIGLLHNIHQYDIPGHMSRGYTILDTNADKETVSLSQSIEYCPGNPRPIWFVYSGMGSQWATMGAELMRIPIFAAAIQKCHKVLEPKGIDIVRILTDPDKTIFDNILHSFVGIAAVQIGLTDLLTHMGIVPDNIIGHSVGELGCAYADGCFTAEEMIMSAYSRGLVSVQTPFIRGSMAAVGLGYKAVLPLCPPEIEIACHNSEDSATISGPADIMKEFVAKLTAQGIFAKEVPCSNIAFHSRYIVDGGPSLLKYLSEVIKTPQLRTKKWLSTSVPEEKWDEPIAKYSSAEYHTNNLLNPVLFEETSKLIPSDALVIEIAPHGLLQAILKRSLSGCLHVPLTRRGVSDPVKFFLEAVGKLYEAGLNPKVDVLYPKIEYPVSSGTNMLSQYVEWEHSEDWAQAKYNNKDRKITSIRDFVMSLHDDDYSYLKGHFRNGKYIFPESAFLQLVWENLAMYQGVYYKDLSVVFKDVHFHKEVVLSPEAPLKLRIMILKGSNKFEVSYENLTVVSGYVSEFDISDQVSREVGELDDSDTVTLTSEEIYSIMTLKGYSYKGEFQSIHSSNSLRTRADIIWTENWIPLLDSIIQFNAFANDYDGVSAPAFIRKLSIDVKMHKNAKKVISDNLNCVSAELHSIYDYTKCGGVNVEGLVFENLPVVDQKQNVLTKEFVPHFFTGVIEIKTALQINLQVVFENITNSEVKVTNLLSKKSNNVKKIIKEASESLPGEIVIHENDKDAMTNNTTTESDLLIIDDLLGNEEKMEKIYKAIPNNSFVLALEQDTTQIHPKYQLFNITTAMSVEKQILVLLRKVDNSVIPNVTYLSITTDPKFLWISTLKEELMKSRNVVLVSERQPYCGLLGMVKKLRKEYGNKIGLIIIDDYHVPTFSIEKSIFSDQLQKNMAFNILKKGKWGGYYYISKNTFVNTPNVQLMTTIPSDLESLTWVEQLSAQTTSLQVQVCYAGPSFRDVQNATSKSNHHANVYGMDFSGINNRGEKVMGLIPGGAIANTVEADPDLLWPVPEHWTLEDAATVPLAYILTYYCLSKCNLVKGSNIFVHGGAGALGQAVIAVLHSYGYNVFTTVSDIKKKEFLLKLYPYLCEDNITCSSDGIFQYKVRNNTEDGCCLIFNSLSGENRRDSLKCGGLNSIFLDLSDHDMLKNEDFEMGFLFNAKRYVAINLSSIFRPEYAAEKKQLQLKLSEGIAKGIVRPLTRAVYSPLNVCSAFQLVSSRRHTGKVLINMNNQETMTKDLEVATKISFSSKGTYIVVCDDKTVLGMELADRLIKQGARKLMIRIKPNSLPGYCYTKLSCWNKLNVAVKISTDNLQSEKGCINLLKDGAKLGPILGIFIVQNFSGTESLESEDVATKFNKTAGVVAKLDFTSRNVCNELKYFVVLNYTDQKVTDEYMISVNEVICNSRREISLPALSFSTGLLKEHDENNPEKSRPSISAIFNALEISIKSKYSNAISFSSNINAMDKFKQKASNILGIKDLSTIDKNIRLKNLVINSDAIEKINSLIKEVYNVSYSIVKTQEMTIGDLCHSRDPDESIETSFVKIRPAIWATASPQKHKPPFFAVGLDNFINTLSQKPEKIKDGLDALFTSIDPDECMAAEPLVTMSTTYSHIKEEEELDPKATYLMLVPGFESHHEIFNTVCERLKVQAVAFQYGPELINANVPEIAENLMMFMKKRFQVNGKFYILGYSFGINVALELAALYEKEGHVGIVYCLDSSPDAIRAQLDVHIGHLTTAQLQNNLVQHMYKLMKGRDSEELMQKLEETNSWEEKIELCVNGLRGIVNFSHQYKRCILQGAYKRIMLAREYEPEFTLKSELVLLKGKPHPKMETLPNDYGLSKYTMKPVQVFDITADHASAPHDCRVTSIVNRLLEPKLLEAFKNKNVCWTYLANPVKSW